MEGGVSDAAVRFVAGLSEKSVPADVLHECDRAFVNAIGCVVGGSRHEIVETAHAALAEFAGAPDATVLGRGTRADALSAALLNGLSGAAYSFDDTYSDGLLHPSVSLVAALLPLAERTPVGGGEFRVAFAAGLEIACRLTKVLSVPPAEAEMAWSQTGVVSGVSVALAAGKLLGLDAERLGWAAGIAASESAGTRVTHGSMAASLIFGRAAQTGLRAALLAARGFTGPAQPLEHRFGFAAVFARKANLPALLDGLGQRFELMRNTYKPYPCGLVIHPAIDAALRLRPSEGIASAAIERISVFASSAAVKFGNRPEPRDDLQAKVSLQHWVAAALKTGRAGLAEGKVGVVHDPEVAKLRSLIEVAEDGSLESDCARMEIRMVGGEKLSASVVHCVGSLERPMTDSELRTKCVDQAALVIGTERAAKLCGACWALATLDDAGHVARLAA